MWKHTLAWSSIVWLATVPALRAAPLMTDVGPLPYYATRYWTGSKYAYAPLKLDGYGSIGAVEYWWDTDRDDLFGPDDLNGSPWRLGTTVGDGVGPELTIACPNDRTGTRAWIALKVFGDGRWSDAHLFYISFIENPTPTEAPLADAGGHYTLPLGADLNLAAGSGLVNAATVEWQLFTLPRTLHQSPNSWPLTGESVVVNVDQIEQLLGSPVRAGDEFMVRQRVRSPSGYWQTAVATVTVVSIPEPATAGALLLGLAACGLSRSRARRRS